MNAKPSRPFALLAILVFFAGAVTLSRFLLKDPAVYDPELALVVAAAALSESYALRLKMFTVSIAFPLVVAAVVIWGPVGGGIVAAASFTNIQEIRSRRHFTALAFNFGQLALAGCAAGVAYVATGAPHLQLSGTPALPAPGWLPAVFVGVVVGATVFWLFNTMFLAAGLWLDRQLHPRHVFAEFATHIPTQVALACVGLLVAAVLAINPWAFPLFLFPLFLARQVYQRYASLSEAYLDTVRSLIGALEAKDPYTRGHSERVARYAVALVRQVGGDSRQLEQMEGAALLHDIGKLAQSSAVLAKPQSLTHEEARKMREHPGAGQSMVERIPPLRGLAPYVGAHHERPDGTGYPKGLTHAEIPEEALILSIADAYDAMTTSRAYRPRMSHEEAVGELVAGAGGQFDEGLVREFIAAGIRAEADGLPRAPFAPEVLMLAGQEAAQ